MGDLVDTTINDRQVLVIGDAIVRTRAIVSVRVTKNWGEPGYMGPSKKWAVIVGITGVDPVIEKPFETEAEANVRRAEIIHAVMQSYCS